MNWACPCLFLIAFNDLVWYQSSASYISFLSTCVRFGVSLSRATFSCLTIRLYCAARRTSADNVTPIPSLKTSFESSTLGIASLTRLRTWRLSRYFNRTDRSHPASPRIAVAANAAINPATALIPIPSKSRLLNAFSLLCPVCRLANGASSASSALREAHFMRPPPDPQTTLATPCPVPRSTSPRGPSCRGPANVRAGRHPARDPVAVLVDHRDAQHAVSRPVPGRRVSSSTRARRPLRSSRSRLQFPATRSGQAITRRQAATAVIAGRAAAREAVPFHVLPFPGPAVPFHMRFRATSRLQATVGLTQ